MRKVLFTLVVIVLLIAAASPALAQGGDETVSSNIPNPETGWNPIGSHMWFFNHIWDVYSNWMAYAYENCKVGRTPGGSGDFEDIYDVYNSGKCQEDDPN